MKSSVAVVSRSSSSPWFQGQWGANWTSAGEGMGPLTVGILPQHLAPLAPPIVPVSAQTRVSPATMPCAMNPPAGTSTGVAELFGVPSPSSPNVLSPQQYTLLSEF